MIPSGFGISTIENYNVSIFKRSFECLSGTSRSKATTISHTSRSEFSTEENNTDNVKNHLIEFVSIFGNHSQAVLERFDYDMIVTIIGYEIFIKLPASKTPHIHEV